MIILIIIVLVYIFYPTRILNKLLEEDKVAELNKSFLSSFKFLKGLAFNDLNV